MKNHPSSTRSGLVFLAFLVLPVLPLWGEGDSKAPGSGASSEIPPEGSRLISAQELDLQVRSMATLTLAEIQVGDILTYSETLALYNAQQQYLRKVRGLSYILPGLGHFPQGSILEGSFFLAGDLAITAGILLVTHALLPASVQYPALDYFQSPYSTVKTAWENLTLVSILPSAGFLAAGSIAQWFYRSWAANRAQSIARQRIAEGEQTFTVRPMVDLSRGLFMGLSVHHESGN